MAADEHDVPGQGWSRFGQLVGVGARSGLQRFLPQSVKEKAMQRSAEALGRLRGLAAKAGQIASYVDGIVPEEQRELYERWMKGLLSGAARSPEAAVRALFVEELGEPPETRFARWEPEPVASASIGQVHRATLHDGREVAVKVQHPGVAQALEADLGQAAVVEQMVGWAGMRQLNSKALLEEFAARLREELDYRQEAQNQEAFRRLHLTEPAIHIPAVVAEHSRRRVLCSEWAQGLGFDAACAASEEERAAWCRTLWRFVFGSYLLGGVFNADPHPGNYMFLPRGRVTFLDFGCVQRRDPSTIAQTLAVHRAAVARDEAGFREHVRQLLGTPRGSSYERWALDYVRLCFEPVFASPFRMTRPFAASMVAGIRDIAHRWRELSREGIAPLQPGMLFMNRLQCGFYSVLARLDATVDYAAIEASILEAALPNPALPNPGATTT